MEYEETEKVVKATGESPFPRIIAIANQKGGSGKTTTAVNLAACLAERRRDVLLVDLDPQGNATIGLGIESDELTHTVYDVLINPEIVMDNIIVKTKLEHLSLAPSNIHLSGAEIELVNTIGREIVLKEKLDDVANSYHYVILDCPPSLGLLTLNALTTAHEVIIPVQTHFYALEGMSQLINTIDIAQKRLNRRLKLLGILPTMFQVGTKLCERVLDELRGYFNNRVFTTVIRHNIKLAEAPSHGLPINLYAADSNGAKDYKDFAREVVRFE